MRVKIPGQTSTCSSGPAVLAKKRTFKSGEVIVRENTLGNSAYIIESGNVEVSKNVGNQRVVFAELGMGALFGEMCLLLDDIPRSATIKAIEDTTVTILSKKHFQEVLHRVSPVVMKMFKMIAERLRETSILVHPLKLTNFYYSLCNLLYYLAKAEAQQSEDGLHLNFDLAVDESCSTLALEKEMVENVINKMVFTKLVRLKKRKLKDREEKVIIIPEVDRLKKFNDFLKTHSRKNPMFEGSQNQLLQDNSYKILKIMLEEVEEFKQQTGKISVSYKKCREVVKEQLGTSDDKTYQLFKPFCDIGLFKLTIEPGSTEQKLVCYEPQRLKDELDRQDELRSFNKMLKLLKTLAEKK